MREGKGERKGNERGGTRNWSEDRLIVMKERKGNI